MKHYICKGTYQGNTWLEGYDTPYGLKEPADHYDVGTIITFTFPDSSGQIVEVTDIPQCEALDTYAGNLRCGKSIGHDGPHESACGTFEERTMEQKYDDLLSEHQSQDTLLRLFASAASAYESGHVVRGDKLLAEAREYRRRYINL